jgi:hypothetical protein
VGDPKPGEIWELREGSFWRRIEINQVVGDRDDSQVEFKYLDVPGTSDLGRTRTAFLGEFRQKRLPLQFRFEKAS